MTKPRLIILIRHAQSEGNKNRDIHQTIPDHRVKLTPDGWNQAHDAGRRLRALLRPDDTLHFFTSPYRRTRETTEGILSTLTSDEPEPSPFRRSNIKVYEEPRLREQDFGNFQPCSAEMERMWQERADYGHFFYRIPNGESAADAYDRVSGFNESLWRQFGEDDFASVCVLVTHGLMSRVFLMKWYHFTVEYFEDLCNINHCELLIMRKQENSKYLLENKLRTWSELRRQRALEEKETGKEDEKDKDICKLERNKTFIVHRRWGGCPNGCNHGITYKTREDIDSLRQLSDLSAQANGPVTIVSRRLRQQTQHAMADAAQAAAKAANKPAPAIDVNRSREEVVSSPDGTPSFITSEDRLRSHRSPAMHIGRDFGGSYSGHASAANSDNDTSDDEARRARHRARQSKADTTPHSSDDEVEVEMYSACVNRLGDAPSGADSPLETGSGVDDIDEAEKKDRSIQGSVY
jgi:broad specificity phosphatase PhoE